MLFTKATILAFLSLAAFASAAPNVYGLQERDLTLGERDLAERDLDAREADLDVRERDLEAREILAGAIYARGTPAEVSLSPTSPSRIK